MAGPESSDSSISTDRCRLIVIGAGTAALVRGDEGFGNYAEIIAEHPDLESWTPDKATADADLVIATCPTLFPETLDNLRAKLAAAGANRAVVIYEFAQRGTEQALDTSANDITALRAPIRPEDPVRAACEADIALATLRERWVEQSPAENAPETVEIPPRQFSDEQLANISQISTTIDCECPHHLSALLGSLNAFETYSRECENRNDDDAVLHAYLHRSAARARAIIEDALVVLAEAEGFDID